MLEAVHCSRGLQATPATCGRRLLKDWERRLTTHRSINAVLESFFATLKTELIHHKDFVTRRQATGQIFWFIEGFYNTSRKHSFLGQISPRQFEERDSTP